MDLGLELIFKAQSLACLIVNSEKIYKNIDCLFFILPHICISDRNEVEVFSHKAPTYLHFICSPNIGIALVNYSAIGKLPILSDKLHPSLQ